MPTAEFLLEVRAEEIPSRMVAEGTRELATRLFEELVSRRMVPDEITTGFTPRRLVVCLQGLPLREPDSSDTVLGPPAQVAWDENGEPTRALTGFAERCGVGATEVTRVETDKGTYAGVTQTRRGREAADVLSELVPRVLRDLRWPKSMRWGKRIGPWIRPVRGIVALLDGAVVPFELFGVAAGSSTCGHPLLSPEPFDVDGWEDYRERLDRLGIEVRPEERRSRLAVRLGGLASETGGTVVEDPELLDRVTAMCEIPGAVLGSFDREFLSLPREVLTVSLRDHQSAFAVEQEEDRLAPHFLTVMDREDDPEQRVRSGNEWVVRARLADARFFYDEDRKTTLEQRASLLERLTFHEKLGSYAEKAVRVSALVDLLCRELGWVEEAEQAQLASRLLKVDLTTEMVREFTSLQGVIGGIYAREEGYPDEVWQAVYDQYRPATPEDAIPRGRVGMATALADRIDSLAGIFGIGEVPTGSRDPLGLRRAAQGVVRILMEADLSLDLDLVAAKAIHLYGERIDREVEAVLQELRPFLHDRIRHLLGREGYRYDEVAAGMAAGVNDLPDLRARVEALHRMRGRPGFEEIVQAARRIENILRGQPQHEIDEDLLTEAAERELFEAGRELEAEVVAAAGEREYRRGLEAVAGFAAVLDRFFEEVLVMDENPELRSNRIALLQGTRRTLSRLARLHELVVEKGPGAAEERQ